MISFSFELVFQGAKVYFLVVFVLAHLQIHYYNSLCLAADVSWILPSIIRTPSAPNSVLASKRFVLLKTIQ